MHPLAFVLFLAACGTPAESTDALTHDKAEKAQKTKQKVKAKSPEVTPPAPIPTGAKVRFLEPLEGAKVKGPLLVKFAVDVMSIRPAGEIVPETGHHHLIIDGGPIAAGTVVPMDDKHLHFGKGQTETTVELPAGEHKLTMQFADGAHVSYGEPMSATITVTVE